MRTFIVLILAVVLAVAAAWGATRYEFRRAETPLSALMESPDTTALAPVAVVNESEVFHFGTMNVDTKKSHTFIIKNNGTAPLVLTKGHTSCKCTLSELNAGEVAPGKTAEVNLEWHPPGATEEFEQSAEIQTNDPQRPRIQLIVRGRVLDALKLDPATLTVGDVSVNDTHTFETTLWSYRTESFQLESWEFDEAPTAPFFSLQAVPVSADELKLQPDAKAGWKVQISLKQGAPLGAISQKVILKHNVADVAPLSLTITGKGVGDITVISPLYVADKDYLELGNVVRSQGFQTKIYLLAKGPRREGMKLSVLEVDPAAALQVKIGEPSRPSEKSILWPVEIQIPAGSEPISRIGSEIGKLAKITLATNDTVTPQVVLRVRVAVVQE
jgi:Protein of unknown function (DUF1573)